jgi:hypothetical protein
MNLSGGPDVRGLAPFQPMDSRVSDHGIPADRREAALVYYSLIRAYWRQCDAARLGPIKDIERSAIEAETVDLLAEAG